MLILVVGATGHLGQHVVRQLVADGHTVRAMTRVPVRARAVVAAGAEVVVGDLRDAASLHDAVCGAEVVVSAAHSMLGTGKRSSAKVDDAGQCALIAAARHAGVSHFVFTSVLGAALTHPVDFWRTKAKVEQQLQVSGLAFTIVRPAAFMEMHAYELIGKAVASGKRVVIFGPGDNPRNYVAAADVASLVVHAVGDASLRGATIEVGGPENLTTRQVIAIFERVTGRRATVVSIPLPVLRAMAPLLAPLHGGVSRILRASVVGETTDQAFDPASFQGRFPVPLTRLEDWARARLV